MAPAFAPIPPPLLATCLGTRGSVPSPGPDTVRYGGNTPCLEVLAAGRRFLFDAGTGIRTLSRRLAAEGKPLDAELFVTHFHWDHIQGFPFCTQLFEPGHRIRAHGPRLGGLRIEGVLAGQMSSVYFPVPLEAIAARLEFRDAGEAPWAEGGVVVRAAALRHPGGALGYRIEAGGAALAYLPDNELGEGGGGGAGWYGGLVDFLAGADVLLHDAMYTEGEYAAHAGWGHSTAAQAVRLAADAGVRRLVLFHHAPDRTDAEVDAILADARRTRDGLGGTDLQVDAAVEGREIAVAEEEDGGSSAGGAG